MPFAFLLRHFLHVIRFQLSLAPLISSPAARASAEISPRLLINSWPAATPYCYIAADIFFRAIDIYRHEIIEMPLAAIFIFIFSSGHIIIDSFLSPSAVLRFPMLSAPSPPFSLISARLTLLRQAMPRHAATR
jgi:hypothetical protein